MRRRTFRGSGGTLGIPLGDRLGSFTDGSGSRLSPVRTENGWCPLHWSLRCWTWPGSSRSQPAGCCCQSRAPKRDSESAELLLERRGGCLSVSGCGRSKDRPHSRFSPLGRNLWRNRGHRDCCYARQCRRTEGYPGKNLGSSSHNSHPLPPVFDTGILVPLLCRSRKRLRTVDGVLRKKSRNTDSDRSLGNSILVLLFAHDWQMVGASSPAGHGRRQTGAVRPSSRMCRHG